jgi:hypothetical protein
MIINKVIASLLLCVVVAFDGSINYPASAYAQEDGVTDGAEEPTLKTGASKKDDSLIRAAIFVQNNAGPTLDESVSTFRDLLSARLADKGFSILDSHDVIAAFQETKNGGDPVDQGIAAVTKVVQAEKTESSVEQVLNGASALRIAQMLDANYLIVATLSSVGTQKKSFNGEGTLHKTNNEVIIRTLRTSIRVLEGNQGGTVYGDTVAVSDKIGGPSRLSIETDDMNNTLIDNAAATIAENISKKLQRIRDAKVDTLALAELTLTSNVEGATLEIDGAVLGTVPGQFPIKPGLHQIAVSKEWYTTWRRTINVVPNQVINVTMERSKEGEARYAESLRNAREDELTRKRAEAEIEIAKQQSEADAYAKKQVAEGEKEFRKNSHTQIEGPVDNLTVGRGPDSIIKVERE